MVNSVVFANNDTTTLAAAITSSQTSITLVNGAAFPSPAAGQFFPVTFISASNSSILEIAYCTARSSNTLTVTRGQEGTAAQAFNAGDTAANLLTAGAMNLLPQLPVANTWTATQTFHAGASATGIDAGGVNFRFYSNANGYGAGWLNDNSFAYLLLTNNGNPAGPFNSLRPISVSVSTGAVSIDFTGVGTAFGGPVTLVAPASNDASNRATTSNWIYGAMQYVASAAGFVISPGSNGYVKFPNWLGSWMVQWGQVNLGNGSSQFVALPTTFPNAHLASLCSYGSIPLSGELCGSAPGDQSTILIGNVTTTSNQIFFFSVGY